MNKQQSTINNQQPPQPPRQRGGQQTTNNKQQPTTNNQQTTKINWGRRIMQVNQVSLINYKILHQSLGGFKTTQKLLVHSSNILPIAFLLLPSVAQSQTLDNFYRGQPLNNLTDQLDPPNTLNQPVDLSTNLLLNIAENQPLNNDNYPGLNSAGMRFEAMASGLMPVDLFGTTTELVDAEGVTGGLPKLWVSAYDINLEPKFLPPGAEVIQGFASQVQGDISAEFIEDSRVYRSLIIGATLNNQLNLLPTEAQKQNSLSFNSELPKSSLENHQSDAGVSADNHDSYIDLFSGFFPDSTAVSESDIFTIYSASLAVTGRKFSLNNVGVNSETFSPAIASTLLLDRASDPGILLSEGFRDILDPENISVNSVTYQTLIAPEIPYVYAGYENITVAAINPDAPVSDETVFAGSEISDPWQEIPAKVNLTAWSGFSPEFNSDRSLSANVSESGENAAILNSHNPRLTANATPEITPAITPKTIGKNLMSWSGLPPEFSPESRDSAKGTNGANRPPVNQKSGEKSARWSDSIVLDQIADSIPPQSLQGNTRSWSGLPPEFSPESRDRSQPNPANPENPAYFYSRLSGQFSSTVPSWGDRPSTPSEAVKHSESFSNSEINLDSFAEPLPTSDTSSSKEISEFSPSEFGTPPSLPLSSRGAEGDGVISASQMLPNPESEIAWLPTVPPLSLPIAEGIKSAPPLSSFATPVVPSLDAEFPNQTQPENNSENNPENNSYTIQAKVLDSPVSYLIDRQSWSEAYSSLINRDLQNSLEAIALTTHSTPGVVYVLAFSDYIELMLLSPGQPIIRRIVHHANLDVLNATVQELVADITNPRTLGSDRYLSSAQQLYQWLISPIEGELQDRGIDTLMFSLDPNIRSLPIAALHDGQQFLVEKYRLSLIPSLNLTDLSYQNLTHSAVLAMGASEFADSRIQPLDQVPLELSAIAQNRPGQVQINEAFTPENLKYQSDRGNYQIIHLATHVEFNPENTQNSYIQFWNSRLTLHEIQEIGWQNQPLELLVMSGCETAFGSPNAELGFAGLAVQNGVKSVLASLWQVDDQGTLGLMSEFYRHLNSQPQTIKAEALRQAQLAMLQGKIHIENGQLTWVDDNPQTSSQSLVGEIGLNHQQENISSQTQRKNLAHPYFWAAFTLVGNPW